MKRNQIQKFRCLIIKLGCFFLFFPYLLSAQNSQFNKITIPAFRTPSDWVQSGNDILNHIENTVSNIPDASVFNSTINDYYENFNLLKENMISIEERSNLRNLNNMSNQLGLLIQQSQKYQAKIKSVSEELYYFISIIDKFQSDTNKSISLSNPYISEVYKVSIGQMKNRMEIADTLCMNKLKSYSNSENSFNDIILLASKINSRVDQDIATIKKNLLKSEEPYIWNINKKKYPPYFTILKETLQQKYTLLLNYTKASILDLVVFRIVVLLFAFIPLMYVRRIYKKQPESIYTKNFKYVHRHTSLMAPAVILCMAPIIFEYPPLLFLDLIFVTVVITIMFILLKDFKTLNKKLVVFFLVYYIILKFANISVDVTIIERLLFTGAMVLLPVNFIFIKWIKDAAVRNKKVILVMFYTVNLLILAGCVFNFIGMFIFSKMIVIAALDAMFLVIMLYFAINGIGDYILMLGDYWNRTNKSFKPDLYNFLNKLRPYLFFFAVSFWFIALFKNINIYDSLKFEVVNYLNRPRYAGNFIYNFGEIWIFVFYTVGSFLLSNLLKPLFASENQDPNIKSNWGNYVFLLRIFIITLGFILGLSSAGIPMSTITVFLGAIGVGVGFGLQNIFNNVLSGIIIAFERPFKIGDLLSLEEGLGRVKEIGLRSSVLSAKNGSEIVVPNGDLISKSFINWTHSNSNCKMKVYVNVAKDTDVEKMKSILLSAVENVEGILSGKNIGATIDEITENSLKFELEFWISNVRNEGRIKAIIFEKINSMMKEAKINSPFVSQKITIINSDKSED